ncbi:MAG: hypothetical protein EKK46_03290 [Rhodocyclaceae bacterium]|nr:MAG: hypothetical protein EKK46_03290 [Rhodocyclaceae bacterium]
MSQSLADLLPVEGGKVGLRLWLKASAYTRRLLLGESGDPWESASKYLAYFSQAQGLLKPDVAVIEVGELFDAWLQRNPAAKAELTAKRKLSFPLRKLLEQTAPRELLAEIVEAVVAHLRGQAPVVLAMPSPRFWLHLANRAVDREVELDDDNIEDAAMYVADLVRSVSSLPVGGILFEEAPGDVLPGPVNAELYRPMVNVAKHYRWPLALRLGGGALSEAPALADIDVFIGADGLPVAGSAHGVDISASLWTQDAAPLAQNQFYFVEIPRDAQPEQVLERLARLRS